MLNRSIEKEITQWIKKGKTALLISGARQVGKTFIIRKCLSDCRVDHIELNLLENPDYTKAFSVSNNIDELKMNVSLVSGISPTENKTIIFIDEIQEYPDIITKIKFWVDDGRYRFIMSGSLLGIELKDIRSAPVGYMDELQMYPLDFVEFLFACGVEADIVSYMQVHFKSREALSEVVHDKMMDYFRRYLVVGGMPQVVNSYVENGDMNEVSRIQKNIITQYKRDFTKYEKEEKKLYLKKIYDLIPTELLKQNKRFNYADIKKGLKFERSEDSFLWLIKAGVALPCYNSSEPRLSLKQNEKSNLFKMYLSDVGLLTGVYGNSTKFAVLNGDESVNYGGIYENYVAMELYKNGFDLFYYKSRKLGELDFIIEHLNRVLPIEVKSGKDYYIHSAINNVLNIKDFGIKDAFIFTNYNISTDKDRTYYPIYMCTFLKDDTVLPILDPKI
ncbi:MAG: ATP-binding protein [Lachnospiraceae bacterium]|nr:ATP-binding protein [Lachnospiraceae bacterium]